MLESEKELKRKILGDSKDRPGILQSMESSQRIGLTNVITITNVITSLVITVLTIGQ